ncbi:family 43 glycosylhydrolase [Archangium sp.]|uniref:family 43 glycosylhydrolase n=1 Tax=Archangium sp. TaxID=1872627 RepID=UPI002D34DE2A|nr:family 43 glycosylhydrolase [Archangium sp.]HYO51441.1 family 43 glycosylhydrolase [Archangium sp.]
MLTATACSDEEPFVDKRFTNPLKGAIAGGGYVENCPDPTVIRAPGDDAWYLLCTADPLNSQDKDAAGEYRQHLIAILKSTDLVEWTYVGDALTELPTWAKPGSDLWAPEVVSFGGKYYLYYTVVDTLAGGSAIGVATSNSPAGPWTHAAKPVVEPHEPPCCADAKRWVYDAEVLIDGKGEKYIYYGSYFGGISVRKLSEDGLTSDPYTQVEVTVANRYEAASIIKHGEYYYLLGSSTNCCNGPLSGYSVFAGRSKDPFGPFVDREGVRLTANRVGGTPVLGLNGNRWVGVGHNTVLTDFGGQDWLIYHAIDRTDPYLAPAPDGKLPPKRQVLMDALDWVNDWPVVRGGLGASDSEQPAPAAHPSQASRYVMAVAKQDEPGAVIAAASDEFNGTGLGSQWSWVRPPAAERFGVANGSFRFDTQAADLFEDIDNAAILWQPAPAGNYLVETKLTLNVPPVSCCHNYVQAGLLLHSDDDNYVRLTHVSIWETRQIAFSKEVGPGGPAGYPRFGETAGGPAAETVWLRIARRTQGQEEHYTAYSSLDGSTWSRAGTWTHTLGAGARIGLVSMGRAGFTATFDYVRVHELKE